MKSVPLKNKHFLLDEYGFIIGILILVYGTLISDHEMVFYWKNS